MNRDLYCSLIISMPILVFLLMIFSSVQIYSEEQNHPTQEIGIDEKLGDRIPLALTFYDEKGSPVKLK